MIQRKINNNLPFPYMGGKKRFLGKWIPSFPPHKLYVSIFGGGGSDILCKRPDKIEVFNDLDGDINNFHRVLREQERELTRLIEFTLARGRETYDEAYFKLHAENTSDLQRAWSFLVIAHQSSCFCHPRRCGPKGYSSLKINNRKMNLWLKLPSTLRFVRERFSRVQIERLDFRELLKKYDGPDTFFFADPPYHPEVRRPKLYAHEMTHQDHCDFLDQLREVKAKVFLCGYSHSLYEEKLHDWRTQEFAARAPGPGRAKRTEVVWTNYGPTNV